jgi:hypothetical protein
MKFPILFVNAKNADEYIKHLIVYKTLSAKIASKEEDMNEWKRKISKISKIPQINQFLVLKAYIPSFFYLIVLIVDY